MNKPRCSVIGEYGQCMWDAKYRITIVTNKNTWQMDVCEACRDEEQRIMHSMIETIYKQTILSDTCTPLYDGIAHERARLTVLFTDESRPITWKEVSTLIRRMRWDPYLSTERGITMLMVNRWGSLVRIMSASALRTMTPAQFWQRLRQIDPSRVAEVERNIF